MKTKNSFLTSRILLVCAVMFGLSLVGASAGTYTYIGASGGNWSSTINWSPNGDPGATAGDTANILNPFGTSAGTISYDSGAPGTLGTLNFINTTADSVQTTTTLTLSNSLTLTSGGSIYSTGALDNPTIQLASAAALTIASGANFTVGNTNPSTLQPGSSNYFYISKSGSYTGTGINVNGTLTFVSAPTSGTGDLLQISPAVTLGATGILDVDSEGTGSATGQTRPMIYGNFTTTSGSLIEATSAVNSTTAAMGALYLIGPTINIASGTTFSGFSSGPGNLNGGGIDFNQTTAGTQTVNLGSISGFSVRNNSGGATTTIINSSATVGSINNAIDSLSVAASASATATVQLGSNLNFTGGSYTTPFWFTLNTGSADTAVIDLHGFTYDATAGTAGTGFSPLGTNATNNEYINVVNTGASSLANGQGVFRASYFNTDGADIGIGAGVILNATGAGTAQINDFSNVDSTSTATISSTSTFYYSGIGQAYLRNSKTARALGNVMIGDGSANVSTLQLSPGSAFTIAGTLTPNAHSLLDLNGLGLTMTGSGNVAGAGTVENTSVTATSVGFASGSTGGITPGTNGTAANLSFAAVTNKNLTLNLANSTSVFDITSAALTAGTYDTLTLNGTTLNLNNGSLVVDFGTGTYNGTLQLILLTNSSSIVGTLNSLTSNLGANETLSLDNTGLLTFAAVAVPEPSTTALLLVSLGFLVVGGSIRRLRRSAS